MDATASDAHHPSQYSPRLAVLITDFGGGGVERMRVNIACGLAGCGSQVDFLVQDAHASAHHPWLADERQPPVVLDVGGWRRQKNSPSWFARLRHTSLYGQAPSHTR